MTKGKSNSKRVKSARHAPKSPKRDALREYQRAYPDTSLKLTDERIRIAIEEAELWLGLLRTLVSTETEMTFLQKASRNLHKMYTSHGGIPH